MESTVGGTLLWKDSGVLLINVVDSSDDMEFSFLCLSLLIIGAFFD